MSSGEIIVVHLRRPIRWRSPVDLEVGAARGPLRPVRGSGGDRAPPGVRAGFRGRLSSRGVGCDTNRCPRAGGRVRVPAPAPARPSAAMIRMHAALVLSLLAPAAGAQVIFVEPTAYLTGQNSDFTENVDLADVDLDGDWDALFANGENNLQQNRIWINSGALQLGTLGTFVDETAGRLPVVLDRSRDVEFADIDADGDPDVHVSNSAQSSTGVSDQTNRWWVNQGGVQGATLGFFADETASRFVGLGQSGSSVAATELLPGGGYRCYSEDSDFADLDNDGDLDLVLSSSRRTFMSTGASDQAPTRLFLNDGAGFFSEFNPSGFQPAGSTLFDGSPALWAQGTQQHDTQNATGAFADVGTTGVDVEVGDLDGDFDIDLLVSGLTGITDQLPDEPRVFSNLLEEQAGALGFRDVTSVSLSAGSGTGMNTYGQELGDFDGDGDLDLYGANWANKDYDDRTFTNSGAGIFSIAQSAISGTDSDSNEPDFLDYDNDGDLDVVVAQWGGNTDLLANDGSGTLTPQSGWFTLDGTTQSLQFCSDVDVADVADVDGDGDYDVLYAGINNFKNRLLLNQTDVPDQVAASIPAIEVPADGAAHPGTRALRAHVYDNAPTYVTWYNATWVELAVDGCPIGAFGARSSAGQVFRAEIPANLVGAVTMRWFSEDEHGNQGVSQEEGWTGTSAASFTSQFGPSTDSLTTSSPPRLDVLSVPYAGSTLFLAARGPASTPYLLALYDSVLPGGLPLPGLLVANIGGQKVLTATGALDAAGCASLGLQLGPSLAPGLTAYGQVFTFDGATNGDLLASSQGATVVVQ